MLERDGHWSCSVIPAENPGYSLEARHPDFSATKIASWSPGLSGEEKDGETVRQLWAGRLLTVFNDSLAVRGRVTDEAGNPISNARIDHKPGSDAALLFRTDAKGEFLIPKLKPGPFRFAVSAEGFAPECVQAEIQTGLEPVLVVLKPGALLRLRVVDQAGTEISGATVLMEQWGEHRDALNWSAESGSDGRIEWHSAPRGEQLELCARKNGWCYTRSIQVTADGEEHVITMMPALTLFGRVTDADTGAAVERFKVIPGFGEGRGEQVWERLSARQGTQGEFKLVFGESQQPWQLRVEAEGYQPRVASPIPPNYSGTYEVALKRADPNSAVRGMVLLPDGSPAASANVALLTLDYGATLQPGKFRDQGVGNVTNTDSAGRFAFAPNPRAHSVAAVSSAGFVKMRVKSPAEPLTLKLQAWGTVEGTVAESARARPIEWLALTDEASWNYRGAVALDINAFQSKPDAEGHFLFKQAPAGSFTLFINRQTGTSLSCRTAVEVRPGETTEVTVGGTGRTVTGKLLFPDQTPEFWKKPGTYAALNTKKSESLPTPKNVNPDEAEMWAVDFWQSPAAREYSERNRGFGLDVGTNGLFRVEGVPPGTYQLVVVAGSASLRQDVTIPDTESPDQCVDLGTLTVTAR